MTARTTLRWTLSRSLALVLLLGGAALADLPRLPKDLTLPKSPDSPGAVTFRHESHVDGTRPGCLACHPQRFSILGKAGEERRPAVTHGAMEKGQACGACHGKAAFGFDDCTMCHAQ